MECLICGISKAEVDRVRRKDGYTLGCGIESNTENGFDYDELSPQHRWADWTDQHLAAAGIKPELYEKHRRERHLQWVGCADTVRGHSPVDEEYAEYWSITVGTCILCGKKEVNNE